MAAPKKTVRTNPELAFVEEDLLSLYRRLSALDEWSRVQKAGCLDFVAAVKAGGPRPASAALARYRRMLRRLLELEASPPSPSRQRATVRAGATRAMPESLRTAGQRGKIVAFRAQPVQLVLPLAS